MRWQDIEVQDWDDKVHVGPEAKKFVLANIPTGIVQQYIDDRISVVLNGKKTVSVSDISRVLGDALQGKVKRLSIIGLPDISRKDYIPRRTTTNVINVVPTYELKLELGDIDALFDPVNSMAEAWKEKGVQQRLQVLGYLYTPLDHPGNNAPNFNHAKACWDYYKRVHKEPDNAAAFSKLKDEIYGNLIAKTFPTSGTILPKSDLPGPGTFAAIRFPGGYGTTKSAGTTLRGGDHIFNGSNLSNVDTKYDVEIGSPRDKIEKVVFDENPLLGKLPLIAKVTATFPGRETKPAIDVPVLFQLVMPDDLQPNSPFAAPELPQKVMNYSLNGLFWNSEEYPQTDEHANLNKMEWKAVHRITRAAYASNPGNAANLAKGWIDAWAAAVPTAVPWNCVSGWWGDVARAPYTRLEMPVETAKKYVREQIAPTPPAPVNGYDEQSWDLLIRLTLAAKAANPNWMQAKNIAKGWIDQWNAGGVSPAWDHVSGWWGNVADQPYKAMPVPRSESFNVEDPVLYTKNQLDAIKRGFDVPSKPGTVSASQWDCIKKIVAVAKGQHPGDSNAAIAAAESMVDVWNGDPRISWNDVQLWWGNQLEVPYPTLRPEMVDTAKGRVDFLLNDRLAGENRLAEIDNIGQKKFMNDLLAQISSYDPNNKDPQRMNAPLNPWKGKGRAGIEEIFDKPTRDQEGFHTKRPIQTSDFGVLKRATLPGDTGKNPHSMECKTNDKGIAGVIFKPSHCGGDRYKLRAYIDPEWLKSKAPGVVHRSNIETGTMVVWRNIRIFRYLQLQTTPMAPSPALVELLREGNCKTTSPKFGEMFLDTPLTSLSIIPGAGPAPGSLPEGNYPPLSIAYLVKDGKVNLEQMLKYRPVAIMGTDFEVQFRRGYCELIADCTGIETLTQQEYDEAFEIGKIAWQRCGRLAKSIKWDALFLKDFTSPFFLNIRGHKQYNELTKNERAAYPALTASDASNLTWCLQNFLEGMCEHFAKGGVYPGLTIIQIPRGDTWDQFAAEGLCASPITSGYGTASRSAYLAWTDGKYKHSFIYSATSNALHEIGHVLGLCHQYAGGGFIDEAHQTAIKEKFKTPATDDCVCVMSYTGCYGDLCGKCLLSLRGWRTHG